MMRLDTFLFLVLCFAAAAASGETRTLHWPALYVNAELDRDGRLHVSERHTLEFTGAWNGGERRFRLEPGQQLQLVRITQIDPQTGNAQALQAGSLASVGQYKWFDDHVLRWRSRLPSDPPFRHSVLVYQLDYVLSNLLLVQNGSFVLHHDFAFSQRDGPIMQYTLDFHWDSAWQTDNPFSGHLALNNLVPGRGVVLTIPFRYVAAGVPAGVRWPFAQKWRQGVLLILFGFIGWRVSRFQRHEQRHGRYAPLLPVARIDAAWLEKNIFSLAPEVVGAAWDKNTSAAEVAAVLARMSLEGKLASDVKTKRRWLRKYSVLHLRLLCQRADLKSYEHALVTALFVHGDETDTDIIREHYEKRGFDPADAIRSSLMDRVRRLRGGDTGVPGFHLGLVLVLAALVATVAGLLQDTDRAVTGFVCVGVGLAVYVVAMIIAQGYDRRVIGAPAIGKYHFIPLAGLVAALCYLALATDLIFDGWTLVGLCLWCGAFVNSQLNLKNAERKQDEDSFADLKKIAEDALPAQGDVRTGLVTKAKKDELILHYEYGGKHQVLFFGGTEGILASPNPNVIAVDVVIPAK